MPAAKFCALLMSALKSAAMYSSMDRSTSCAGRSRGMRIGASRVLILGKKLKRYGFGSVFLFNVARSRSMARTFGRTIEPLTRSYHSRCDSEWADVAVLSAVPRKIYVALGGGRHQKAGWRKRLQKTLNVQHSTSNTEGRMPSVRRRTYTARPRWTYSRRALRR